jgi:hypothetical protein
MLNMLRMYAGSNGGAFPRGTNAYDALAKLHPTYDGGTGELLAGITGDRKATIAKLRTSAPLTSNECSWIYFVGLWETDAPNTMLIYERTSGVALNGHRRPGRAVGFVDGSMRQISDEIWPTFLAEQAALRNRSPDQNR